MTDTDLINARQCPECERLRDELNNLRSRIKCIYCGAEYTAEQSTELADHILNCEKSPLVQLNMDIQSKAIDLIDLTRDEFIRICALTDDKEIHGICTRSQEMIDQKYPVIKQRDDLELERNHLERKLDAATDRAEKAEKACCEKDATLNALSSTVTKLCLAIDPASQHGPETDKIVAFLQQQRTDYECKIASLWTLLTQCRCSCYIVGTDETDGGNPTQIKCPRCEALEHFTDCGKEYVHRSEVERLRGIITQHRADIKQFLIPHQTHLAECWLDFFEEKGFVTYGPCPYQINTQPVTESLTEKDSQ